MLIGKDFDKIEFEAFGLDLLEPNAFISDTLILLVSLFLAYKIGRMRRQEPFFKNWKLFFIVFGVAAFFGGTGHVLFNYFGVIGKEPAWYLIVLSVFFVERGMISIHDNIRFKNFIEKISVVKLIIALVSVFIVCRFANLTKDPYIGMHVPTINSAIGLFFSLGYLGFSYSKNINAKFRYMWISLLIMLPSVLIQGIKLNPFSWLDRNDLSHLLLLVGVSFYYISIKGYSKHVEKTTA